MAFVPGLSHSVIVKTPGLLPMQYRAKEIEDELEISSLTIHGWIRKGLPFSRDSRGHIWINGQELAAWIKNKKFKRGKSRMKSNEAYCLKCRRIVKMTNPRMLSVRGKQGIISGQCPQCEGKINRGVRNDG